MVARYRLIPKHDGRTRVVVNLGRASGVNAALRPAFYVLKWEAEQQPSLLGTAVSSLDEAHEKLRAYKARLLNLNLANGNGEGLLHIVALDARRCFDNMDHAKTVDVAVRALRYDEYAVRAGSRVFADLGTRRIRTRHARHVLPADAAFSIMSEA